MSNEMQELQQRLEQQQAALNSLKSLFRQERRRWRVQMGLALCMVIGAVLLFPANHTALAQGVVTLQQLLDRVVTLENKTQYIAVSHGDMYITGTNLYIQNGLGYTGSTNAKGNLIIGYNDIRGNSKNIRTGSHNLILGDAQNYSSFGGFCTGCFNSLSGQYASISGGYSNMASGYCSSVSGGGYNTASGYGASVSGGYTNTASYQGSSVSGGESNTASGNSASISGGYTNFASGDHSCVSGGDHNTSSGAYTSISGGELSTAAANVSSISGGFNITENTLYGWAAGLLSSP